MRVGTFATFVAANAHVGCGTTVIVVVRAFASVALDIQCAYGTLDGGNDLLYNIVLLSETVTFGFATFNRVGVADLYAVQTA